jgi:predicted amidophosphoribosyltransferase
MSRDKKPECGCPYCDGPAATDESLCSPCGVQVERCPDCGGPLPRGRKHCPDCEGRLQTGQGRSRE